MLHVRGQASSPAQWGVDPMDSTTPLVANKFAQDFAIGFNQRLAANFLVDEHLTEVEVLALGGY
jgi:hypothetical protein